LLTQVNQIPEQALFLLRYNTSYKWLSQTKLVNHGKIKAKAAEDANTNNKAKKDRSFFRFNLF
jgi:hypothetical protein